jgi:hypothetical protein
MPINRYGLDNGFQLAPIFSFKKFWFSNHFFIFETIFCIS